MCLIDFKCAVIIITTIIIIAVSCFFVINGTPVFPGHSLMEPLVLPQPNGTSQWCSPQPNGTLGAPQANGTLGAPPAQWDISVVLSPAQWDPWCFPGQWNP